MKERKTESQGNRQRDQGVGRVKTDKKRQRQRKMERMRTRETQGDWQMQRHWRERELSRDSRGWERGDRKQGEQERAGHHGWTSCLAGEGPCMWLAPRGRITAIKTDRMAFEREGGTGSDRNREGGW